MFKHLTVILAFLMTIGSPVVAQDFQKGLAAAKAGDYATALQEWTPLAEAGDAKAQNKLGVMYDNGLGVPQDYLEALKWFRMAAEQGHADAQHSLGYRVNSINGFTDWRTLLVDLINQGYE
jgi:TPR repeat protein